MENFVFYNPVKIIFGKGQVAALASEVPQNKRILLTYGHGSIKRNGVYDQIKAALQKYMLFEFSGIEPNPQYETLMQAVKLIKEQKIDYILAAGGGSVVDGTKFIAAAADYSGDPWDMVAKGAPVKTALPFGVVLTLPAAGSEMNCYAVISRNEDKLAFQNPLLFPQFSILDPTFSYTLSHQQTSNGIVDAFVHVIEQYLTYPVNSPLQDRISESILLTLIAEAPKVMANPQDYESRANVTWCACMALNGLAAAGVPEDWATHMISHEITALYGIDHGRALAFILPNLMFVKREYKKEKILQYGERVWGVSFRDDETRITQTIAKTRDFFVSLGMKMHLKDYDVDASCIPIIIKQLEKHNMLGFDPKVNITKKEAELILRDCL